MNAVTVIERFCGEAAITAREYRRLNSLVNAAAKAQEMEHNDSDHPGVASAAASEAMTAVEQYAKNLGFTGIMWPGLYPVFVKGDRQFHLPE